MRSEISFFMKYLPMEATLISQERAELPSFLGSTLRGVIGQTLYQNFEAYNYLYNNRSLDGNKHDTVNPYIILPPRSEESVYNEGDELTFQVFLLGKAVQYAPQMVLAIEGIDRLGMGACRYPFKLKVITHSLDQRVIWEDGAFHEISARSVVLPYRCLPSVRQLRLQTLTPLRIRRNGKLLDRIDFPTIIRNTTRRIAQLTERYGGWIDWKEAERVQALSADISIVKKQLELVSLERYSSRLDEKMDFSGLMGKVWFEGTLTPFVPWLYAAEILHIGRNTTFGMGQIKVEFL